MIYSPFHDKKQNKILIDGLEYYYLHQLKQNNILEGYYIQFMKSWDKETKIQISKIITSFANSGGGWIFLGVDKDGELVGILSKRQNFDKLIDGILDKQTTEEPSCTVRFIQNPELENTGIIVIYVNEGENPPYISNGTIYVRNGSPEPLPAERSDIEELIKKRTDRIIKAKNELEEFCKNETHPYYDEEPLCCIYLYNEDKTHKIGDEDLIEIKDKMTSDEGTFHFGTLTPDSVILNSLGVIKAGVIAPVMEIFNDYSAKIIAPLIRIVPDANKKIIEQILMYNPYFGGEEFRFIKTYVCYNLMIMLKEYFQLLHKHEINTEEFTVVFHLQKIDNIILYFDFEDDAFHKFIMESGLPYSIRKSWKSPPLKIPIIENENYSGPSAISLFIIGFTPPFGYTYKQFWDLMNKELQLNKSKDQGSKKSRKKDSKKRYNYVL